MNCAMKTFFAGRATVMMMVMVMVTIMQLVVVWMMKKGKSDYCYGGRPGSLPFCWFLW